MKTTNNISSCLWFDDQAEEAANFYTFIFENSKITATTHYTEEPTGPSGKPVGSVLTVGFEIEGYPFMALNGGSHFKINPSISFFVTCDSKEKIDELWAKLIDSGKELMPLDKYSFSERYGWVQDEFGVSWQLILNNPEGDWRPKIVPSLLFTQEKDGKAEEAIKFYTSVFGDSKIGQLERHPEDTEMSKKGTLMFGEFMIEGSWIAAMDGGQGHDFTFNEGVSIMVHCDTQDEIDRYWEKLTADGGEESMCGWLKDRYGVSWQIVPRNWEELLKPKGAMQAMMQMRKLDIEALKQAAN